MRTMKSVFGVIGAAVPILYCGVLLYYFLDQSGGSLATAKEIGLGPTVIGLAAVGGLFCLAFIARLIWMFAGSRSQASAARIGSSTTTHDDDSDFDADAVIARHMARRSADAGSGAASAADGSGPARPSFGRKGT